MILNVIAIDLSLENSMKITKRTFIVSEFLSLVPLLISIIFFTCIQPSEVTSSCTDEEAAAGRYFKCDCAPGGCTSVKINASAGDACYIKCGSRGFKVYDCYNACMEAN